MPEPNYIKQLANRDDIIGRHEISIAALEAHIEELKKYIKVLEAKVLAANGKAGIISH